ncbi:PKD-like family lipoprotein [Sphingobacterium lumbrici]|uniref:PKD-like family lipoprotein n=1 Tax=Sphingobacterium lumbrici TaxID=2559600 RepID=UPI001127CF91|nr:PKD-like family lipoprotein [Sphingobacterium lumbrici]
MRRVYLILIYIAVAVSSSCTKDIGNYDYSESEEISILGIEKEYPVIQFKDLLNITPDVQTNVANPDLEFCYYVYNNALGDQLADTLGTGEKDLLNYPVALESGEYTLVFKVFNKTTSVAAFHTSKLTVSSTLNNGWYVLKSDRDSSDMDYFNLAGEKSENVIFGINGRKLAGNIAERIGVNNNYSDPNRFIPQYNSFEKTVVIVPNTNTDAVAIKLSTGKILNSYDQLYQEAPSGVPAPGMYFATGSGQYITNAGKAYFFFNYSSLLSRFGPQLTKSDFTDYKLSKFIFCNGIYTPMGFDEMSSTFFDLPTNGSYLAPTENDPSNELSVENNNMQLLFGGAKAVFDDTYYAVMQNKTSGEKLIAEIKGTRRLKIMVDKLDANDPANTASFYTLNHSALKMMYFISGTNVYTRSVAGFPGTSEMTTAKIPTGETPTFIKHLTYPMNGYNYLLIGTSIDGNYKIYFYPLNTLGLPISSTPEKILSGQGIAGDIAFVFPAIMGTSFPFTY